MANVSLVDGHIDGADTCVICGRDIPEGSQYCVICGYETKNNLFKSTSDVFVKWQKDIDNAILGEIKEKAIENGIKTEYLLNEKAIINALEKQIPKKPIDGCYPWCICPACGGSVYLENMKEHILNNETTYCEHCGQALLWESEVDTE